mgnify:CR=1 FL=1
MLEHPINSRIWHTPELVSLARKHHGLFVTLDQCGYGAKWRKRTKLMCFNVFPEDLSKLSRLCRGPNGCCSFSGNPHVILEGLASPGVKWTAVAAAYPRRLADLMVQTLLAPSRLACASQLEKSLFRSPPSAAL